MGAVGIGFEDILEGQRLMAAKWFHENNFPRHGDAVVYIMEFAGDIVKVGQTVNYAARMKAHGYTARDMGVEIGRVYWQRSLSLLEDEHKLKAFAAACGGVRRGKSTEWFTGVDFDALTEMMLNGITPAPRPIPDWAVLEEEDVA